MSLSKIALATLFVASCSTLPAPAPTEPSAPEGRSLLADTTSKRITGVAVDAQGEGVKAQVALVSMGGSMSVGTSRGNFEFNDLRHQQYALSTWTQSGKWGLMPYVLPGTEGVVLSAKNPGAFLDVTMTGRETLRLAILHRGVPFNNCTLHEGRTSRFVVPTEGATYRLYGKGVEREGELALDAGSVEALAFNLAE